MVMMVRRKACRGAGKVTKGLHFEEEKEEGGRGTGWPIIVVVSSTLASSFPVASCHRHHELGRLVARKHVQIHSYRKGELPQM
jgi:hypothetical protein